MAELFTVAVYVFLSWWLTPALTYRQATVARPDGIQVVVYSVVQDSDVPFDGQRWFVRVGGRTHRLDDFGFESNNGPLFQSPDGKRVAALQSFRNSLGGGLDIDLATGEVQPLPGDATDKTLAAEGWTRRRWHTSLEFATQEQLFADLRSNDTQRSVTAQDELGCRPWDEADWPLTWALVTDATVNASTRRSVGERLHIGRPVRQLRELANDLDHADPDRRIAAAWVIGVEYGWDDETLRFDIADADTRKSSAERVERARVYARDALAKAAKEPWNAEDFQ